MKNWWARVCVWLEIGCVCVCAREKGGLRFVSRRPRTIYSRLLYQATRRSHCVCNDERWRPYNRPFVYQSSLAARLVARPALSTTRPAQTGNYVLTRLLLVPFSIAHQLALRPLAPSLIFSRFFLCVFPLFFYSVFAWLDWMFLPAGPAKAKVVGFPSILISLSLSLRYLFLPLVLILLRMLCIFFVSTLIGTRPAHRKRARRISS